MQTPLNKILKELETNSFAVETDTRRSVSGKVFFALKGDNFDGSDFVENALAGGALCAVTENIDLASSKVYVVGNVLDALQTCAKIYRQKFNIPILAIGGSNGKTTTRELVERVLSTKYRTHSSEENLNNHIGVPLSILSMSEDAEIGVFEIGANHPGEHTELLNILKPTIVSVTNNGLDHLEGFGSPEGVRMANKEIYDWALKNRAVAFVNKGHHDLLEDSRGLERITYPIHLLNISKSSPLTVMYENKEYATNMVGDYNLENIDLAIAFGNYFEVHADMALQAISQYQPSLKRSQFMKKDGMNLILDCYNANPSSMSLAVESFLKSTVSPRGVILGDMLELGKYSEKEHRKIIEYISRQNLEVPIFIGGEFKKALINTNFKHQWFSDSNTAKLWFDKQDFSGFTLLLKGSRGIAVEKVVGM